MTYISSLSFIAPHWFFVELRALDLLDFTDGIVFQTFSLHLQILCLFLACKSITSILQSNAYKHRHISYILKSQKRPTRKVFVYKIQVNPIHAILKYGDYYDFMDS